MSELPVSQMDVRFGRLEQRRGQKQVMAGTLDIAENVIQVEEGVYEKRDGYTPLDRTTSTGTITTASDVGVADGELALVSQDSIYRRDSLTSTWKNSGEHRPAFGTYDVALNAAGFRPSFCVDSLNQTWCFAGTSNQDGTATAMDRKRAVRVVDASGAEVLAETLLIGPTPTVSGKPFVIGSHVYYMFLVGRALRVYDFTASSPASVVSTTYITYNVGASVYGFDVRVTGSTAVVFTWGINLNGTNEAVAVSKFDTSTNLPNVTPGTVYSFFADSRGCLNAGCLLVNNPFAGAVSHSLAAAESDKLEAFTINSTSLACTFNTIATGLYFREYSTLCGIDNTTTWTVWRGGDAGPGFLNDPTFDIVRRYAVTVSGWTATSTMVANGAWLVADPAVIGSNVYIVVGHEDVLVTSPGTLSAQRCFSLIDGTTGLVLGRALYEVGGGDIDGQAGGFTYSGYIAPIRVSGTQIQLAVGACRDGLYDFYSVMLTFETAPVIGPGIQAGDHWILGGGFPVTVHIDGAIDTAPQFYPETIAVTAVNDGGTNCPDGTYTLAATYVVIDADGNEVESQPSALEVQVTAAEFLRVVVPNLRQVSRVVTSSKGSRTFIRLYSTTDANTTLYQQAQVPNNPASAKTTIDIRTPGAGRILYTEGGVIENTAVPPFRAGCYADNRVFITDLAERGVTYVSKIIRPGKLPEFFDGGRFNVGDVRCRAVCAVDRTYIAIFAENGIYYVTGSGPTDVGGDVYLPKGIKGTQTTTNPRSVCETPLGCVFQGRDGGIYLLDSNLAVQFIGRGIDDLRSSTVMGVTHLASAQHIRFALSTGEIAVFDYGRRPSGDPKNPELGQWYVWKRGTALTPAASTALADTHVVLDAAGKAWKQVVSQAFDNTAEFIAMKLRLPLTFRGVTGFFRMLRATFLGTWIAAHKVRLTLVNDLASTVLTAVDLASSSPVWDVRPRETKASTMLLTIEEQQYSSTLNKGFKFEGLECDVQTRPGGLQTRTRVST